MQGLRRQGEDYGRQLVWPSLMAQFASGAQEEAALSAGLATQAGGNRRLYFAGKRTEVVRQTGE